MAAIAANPPPSPPPRRQPSLGLGLYYLTHIDISTLSQSELQALSLCSSSTFDLRRTHDLVIPKIDRSLFNESAGSRRQIYSRPRKSQFSASPSSSHSSAPANGHRRRVAGLLPTPKLPPAPPDDPERFENRAIINCLKKSIASDPNFNGVELISPRSDPVPVFQRMEIGGGEIGGFLKRKRGRKPKTQVHVEDRYGESLQIVNQNGVRVDLTALANEEHPFSEELKRKTVGMQSEEELLNFMKDLGGQWGSRRKRRKFVDASVLGDFLPIGWKLLLGLKRKEGRAWIYCRRYISPTGEEFLSCKEVSAFLQSFFPSNHTQNPSIEQNDSIQQDNCMPSESPGGLTHMDQDRKQALVSSSTLPSGSVPNGRGKEVALYGIENLAEVQIHDLFECHKCSMTFDQKDSYLQHLLSFHQRTTRRYRLGSSVGDGVIIKDGKYECQFCHKVFLERRRYNGHVGIHVRNYVRKVEEMPNQKRIDSPARDDLPPSRISKMDALVEIAQNSMMETSPDGSNVELISMLEVDSENSDSPLSEEEMEEDDLTQKTSNQDDCEQSLDSIVESPIENLPLIPNNGENSNSLELFSGKDSLATADEIPKSENQSNFDVGNLELPEQELVKSNDTELCVTKESVKENVIIESVQQISDEHVALSRVSESSMSTVSPSLHSIPFFSAIPDKGEEEELCSVEKRRENITEFDEFRFKEMETLKYNFAGSGQEEGSLALDNVPMDLRTGAEMEGVFGSPVKFESEEVTLNLGNRQQLTVCVWCGIQFIHEDLVSEIQSDSMGFMCPTCKAKISGQLNEFDARFS